ncbi:serine/threonine-protein kinase PRP4 homolog [Penaeus vannamei]|uniref:serine/threonine-protein kinase PRP4 homolog n=1 Tax=Penaeus vannamei TaxID=6689 RepID=UPI00387FA38C
MTGQKGPRRLLHHVSDQTGGARRPSTPRALPGLEGHAAAAAADRGNQHAGSNAGQQDRSPRTPPLNYLSKVHIATKRSAKAKVFSSSERRLECPSEKKTRVSERKKGQLRLRSSRLLNADLSVRAKKRSAKAKVFSSSERRPKCPSEKKTQVSERKKGQLRLRSSHLLNADSSVRAKKRSAKAKVFSSSERRPKCPSEKKTQVSERKKGQLRLRSSHLLNADLSVRAKKRSAKAKVFSSSERRPKCPSEKKTQVSERKKGQLRLRSSHLLNADPSVRAKKRSAKAKVFSSSERRPKCPSEKKTQVSERKKGQLRLRSSRLLNADLSVRAKKRSAKAKVFSSSERRLKCPSEKKTQVSERKKGQLRLRSSHLLNADSSVHAQKKGQQGTVACRVAQLVCVISESEIPSDTSKGPKTCVVMALKQQAASTAPVHVIQGLSRA